MLAALLPTRAMPLSSNPIEIPGCGDLLVEQHEQIHLLRAPRAYSRCSEELVTCMDC